VQPPDTIELVADPRLASSSWMNLAGGVISASVQTGRSFPVQIERRDEVGQVDIRRPERVDGAAVAPVRLGLETGAHAAVGEQVRHSLAALDQCGDDVLAEIVRRIRICRVLAQHSISSFVLKT